MLRSLAFALARVARVVSATAALGVLGCQAASPAGGPEATCARACVSSTPRCSSSQCARGCNLILDRLVEREGGNVLACVAQTAQSCDDREWSRCATRIGIHADGGPPPPPPPRDGEDITEGD